MLPVSTEIYYTDVYTDDKGIKWLSINGNMHYNLSSGEWTEITATEDYQNPEKAFKRALDEWSCWVD